MNKATVVRLLSLVFALTLLAGCAGSPAPPTPAPLSADNLNLIFVVSEDLAYQAPGDVNPTTANLTNQGLQRSLSMATFLQQKVLGTNNVTGIYALEPMTHLQTASNYPDIVALETIQQFAMLNQTSASYQGSPPVTANSYPIFASYSLEAALPDDVAPPAFLCAACQGLDFRDQDGDNEVLVSGIVKANAPGFYVFSAPWETVSAVMANLNQRKGYNLSLPASYISPNYIYAISIAPSGSASLVTYNSYLTPPSTYPVLPPPPLVSTACNTAQTQAFFSRTVTGGQDGAVIPAGTNTDETVYFVRHAEAHPANWWDDGNYIGEGQWRALDLPNALSGKIHPTQVYAVDPAVGNPGGDGSIASSYVRPSLTVEPYAIANNLPFKLAASVPVFSQNPPQLSTAASIYFFNGGTFSNQTILVGWEHDHIPPTVNALLTSYHANGQQPAPNWPDTDYDTIWTVKLDAVGNVTVDNGMCEGISSTPLPKTPPQF
ncbi:MAG: hypothetical protein ACHP8B_08370 [Terriglobales bacterium]